MFTYIGVAALVIGVFFIAYGWISGVKGKTMGKGLILIVAGGMIGIGGNPSKDMPNGSPSMVAVGIFLIVGFIAVTLYNYYKGTGLKKENIQKRAEVIGANALDRFFVECVLAEANDFSLAKNVQRAKLLADKYKLKYPNGIEALYKQGLEAHKAVSRRFVLNDLRKKAKNQKEYADMLMRSGQQKERDWASWGGAVSGVAGFGAGLATAADIQVKNMQIRAENERRRQAALPGYMYMTDSARSNLSSAESVMQEIEAFKLKLTSDVPAQTLMKHLTFSNTDVFVSETGAAFVSTVASLNPNFKIFNDVPAIVDGTIIAKIYEGDRLCGTAQMVLPVYGVGKNVPLNGICIDCCQQGKTYTVKFVAKNLWALEA